MLPTVTLQNNKINDSVHFQAKGRKHFTVQKHENLCTIKFEYSRVTGSA
jgi:hypothetical protein